MVGEPRGEHRLQSSTEKMSPGCSLYHIRFLWARPDWLPVLPPSSSRCGYPSQSPAPSFSSFQEAADPTLLTAAQFAQRSFSVAALKKKKMFLYDIALWPKLRILCSLRPPQKPAARPGSTLQNMEWRSRTWIRLWCILALLPQKVRGAKMDKLAQDRWY